jgi:hypothetical protein
LVREKIVALQYQDQVHGSIAKKNNDNEFFNNNNDELLFVLIDWVVVIEIPLLRRKLRTISNGVTHASRGGAVTPCD